MRNHLFAAALLKTRELLRAIDSGTAAVWERYLHAAVDITGEGGAVYSKADLIRQIKPFPQSVSGHLEMLNFHVRVSGRHAGGAGNRSPCRASIRGSSRCSVCAGQTALSQNQSTWP